MISRHFFHDDNIYFSKSFCRSINPFNLSACLRSCKSFISCCRFLNSVSSFVWWRDRRSPRPRAGQPRGFTSWLAEALPLVSPCPSSSSLRPLGLLSSAAYQIHRREGNITETQARMSLRICKLLISQEKHIHIHIYIHTVHNLPTRIEYIRIFTIIQPIHNTQHFLSRDYIPIRTWSITWIGTFTYHPPIVLTTTIYHIGT